MRAVRLALLFGLLAQTLSVSVTAHAESYDQYISSLIERAKTDAAFAARVKEAGPEAYPVVVLTAAGYDLRSAEYRRAMRLDSQGGGDE